jgi:hypothetical protein
MAKDPAVLFYTSDFLSSTFTMSDEQVGRYIRLLCIQHQKGKLSDKDLKNILTDEDIDIFEKFVKEADGFYYNQRMKDETIRRKNFTESRKHNGSKGGRPKTIQKPSGYAYGKPNDNLTETVTGTVTVTNNLKLETRNDTSVYSIADKMKMKPVQSQIDELDKL